MSATRFVLRKKSELNNLVIGMVLGDTNLRRSKNTSMHTIHALISLDYLEWKHDLLRPYLKGNIETFDNHGYPAARWYVPATSKLNYLYDDFYKSGRKEVNRHLLNRLDNRGLAAWFMDDGCLAIQRDPERGFIKARPFTISTHCFGWTGNRLIQAWFQERHSIEVRIHRDKNSWRIWGNTSSTHKLLDLIAPYVEQVPSMRYKIDMQYVRGPYVH